VRVGAVAVVVGLSLAACGGGSSSRAETPSTRTTSAKAAKTVAVPTAAQLNAALLAVQEMPTGYAVTPDTSNSSDKGPCDKPTLNTQVPPAAKASIRFSKAQAGPFFVESLAAYAGDGAKRIYELAKQLFDSCPKWSETGSDGTATAYSIAPLSFPKLGDATLAFRLTGATAGATAEGDVIVVRKGNLVAVMAGLGTTSILGATSIDSATTESIARAAVTKLPA
jgi:hypothetical protein